jgi:hypothetical protein
VGEVGVSNYSLDRWRAAEQAPDLRKVRIGTCSDLG